MSISKHRTTWILVFLHLAGLQSALMCAGQRNSSLGGPIANQAGGGHTTWLVADFDGDHISDLAVGRTETSCFQLEIHLSTQPNKASVHHRDVLAGMAFLVYDIDRDNDQDLILANPGSLYPAAVWLNDGRGHFEETERLGGFSLLREDPLTLETESSQAEPVAIAQDDDRPLDKSGVLQATVASGTTSLLSPRWQRFAIEVRTFHVSPRSPPSHLAFLS
jgi:hypothetical protein